MACPRAVIDELLIGQVIAPLPIPLHQREAVIFGCSLCTWFINTLQYLVLHTGHISKGPPFRYANARRYPRDSCHVPFMPCYFPFMSHNLCVFFCTHRPPVATFLTRAPAWPQAGLFLYRAYLLATE